MPKRPYDFECPFCGAPEGRRCMTNVNTNKPQRSWRIYYRAHTARRRLAGA